MRRKTVFVLGAFDHGNMIVSRLDWQLINNKPCGIGAQLLGESVYQPAEIRRTLALLDLRHQHFGPGVVAIDGGANVGVHTIEWAKHMTGWGQVIAFEPQERVFYCLAGNIALNNCDNAQAFPLALNRESGTIRMPVPDYTVPASLGGLEARKIAWTLPIGQEMVEAASIPALAIDSLCLHRLDLLKLDIEGMELEALAGAVHTIARVQPLLHVEHIKLGPDPDAGVGLLSDTVAAWGYESFRFDCNLICAHRADPCLEHVRRLHHALLKSQIMEEQDAAA